MATRDVTLNLSVETLGREGIQALEQSVRDLAKQGGAAGPEFEQLANELSRLGDQREALTNFRQIADATGDLAERQRGAAEAVDGLKQRLLELATATNTAKTSQQEAAAAVVRQQQAVNDAVLAIRLLKIETDSAGRNTKDYRDELARLTTAQTAAKNELIKLRDAQRLANQEATAAKQAQNKITSALSKKERALASANTALEANQRAASEAAAAAQKLGVATEDVAAAEAQLVGAYNQVGAATQTLQTRQAELRAERERTAQAAQDEARAFQLVQQSLQAELLLIQQADQSYAEFTASIGAADRARAEAAETAQRLQAAFQAEADAVVDAAEAAQRLERETAVLIASQRELAAQRTFERQAEDARQLLRAAEYVQFWTDALNEAEREGKAFKSALDQLDVRSIQDIQREIEETQQAMALLATRARTTGDSFDGAFASGEAKIQALQREIREVTGQLTLADRAADLFKNSLGQITAGNLIADGIGALVERVKEMGREFFTVNIQIQQLTRALTTVYKDSATAAEQIDFLRSVSNEAGVAVSEISQAFVRFSAATQSSNIPLQESNQLFTSLVRSASTLGLTSDQVSGALEALAQIASKGTVSLEELRQQLGDRLPGALGVAAESLGLTQARLIELVESGQLTSDVFLRAFGPELLKTFAQAEGKIEGFLQGWNRLKNAIVEVAQSASDTSLFTTLGKTFDLLAENIRGVVTGLTLLAERYLVLKAIDLASSFVQSASALSRKTAATVADTAATVTNTAAQTANALAFKSIAAGLNLTVEAKNQAVAASTRFGQALGVLSTAVGLAGTAVRGFIGLLGGIPGVAALVALNAQSLGKWIGETAASFTSAGEKIKAYEAELKRLEEAEKKAAAERQRLQIEQDKLSLKLSAEANEAAKRADAAVINAEKAVKARNAEIAVTEKIVRLSGLEGEALRAAAKAAQDSVPAEEALLAARQSQVAAIEKQIEAAGLARDANGQLTQSQRDVIAALQDKLGRQREETAEQAATVEAIRLEAIQRRLQAELYQDNSNRLEELTQSYKDAKTFAETLALSGTASAQQLAEANARVAASGALVRDSYRDQQAAIQATNTLRQAELNLQVTGLTNRQREIEQLAANARANGDVEKAVRLEIEAKRIQIQITQLTQKAKELEAQATIQATKAELEALKIAEPANEIKRKELEARLLNAQAKELEAKASGLVVKGLQEEIKALQDRANAQGGVNAEIRRGTQDLRDLNAEGRNTIGTFRDIAGAARTAAQEVKGVQLAPDGDAFSNAGRQARNDSFKNTPFQSGSGSGGALTGQAIPPNSDPGWVFVNDARVPYTGKSNGPVLFGYWTRPQGVIGTTNGPTLGGGGGAFDIANPFGRSTAAPTPTVTPATPATGRELIRTDTDTPGTVGTISRVPVLGKFEVEFKANGRTNTVYTDTEDQAQAFIDNLQLAIRNAGGGS